MLWIEDRCHRVVCFGALVVDVVRACFVVGFVCNSEFGYGGLELLGFCLLFWIVIDTVVLNVLIVLMIEHVAVLGWL